MRTPLWLMKTAFVIGLAAQVGAAGAQGNDNIDRDPAENRRKKACKETTDTAYNAAARSVANHQSENARIRLEIAEAKKAVADFKASVIRGDANPRHPVFPARRSVAAPRSYEAELIKLWCWGPAEQNLILPQFKEFAKLATEKESLLQSIHFIDVTYKNFVAVMAAADRDKLPDSVFSETR